MSRETTISRANARYQQWHALLDNRTKRQRAGEFLVQGVRPITLAVEHGWSVRALIRDASRRPSRWAAEMLERAGGDRVAMAPELLRELGGKEQEVPELVAVVALPPDDLARLPTSPDLLAAVFDRPANPGNIGTLVRSLDAFGGTGLVVTGHGADPYDPRAVRASTGSILAVPAVRLGSPREVLAWVEQLRRDGIPVTVVGTDEAGATDIADVDLTGPVLLAVGNETSGLSAAWRAACDVVASIPMTGSASSLNAASAATVVLYEAARQRARAGNR